MLESGLPRLAPGKTNERLLGTCRGHDLANYGECPARKRDAMFFAGLHPLSGNDPQSVGFIDLATSCANCLACPGSGQDREF